MSRELVDTLISGAKLITMDGDRRVLMDGALAIKGNRIAAVGPRAEVEKRVTAAMVIDGRRFVVTPGFINGHIHITGDPLTRGFMPDDLSDSGDRFATWVLPRYFAHGPKDERLSAELAGLEMLRAGTTTFLEAGTIRYLDEAVEGLQAVGIRGRVGIWVEGRAGDADEQPRRTKEAIGKLEDEVARFPASDEARVAAWPILVGHATNPDEVWKAAKSIANEKGLGLSAHMSPRQADPDWYLSHRGCRPLEHLAKIGVLGRNVALTHAVYIDAREQAILAETGTHITLCPLANMKGAAGLSAVGRFPDMLADGINVILGTDGYSCDILRIAQLASALFKDLTEDVTRFSAYDALSMITLKAAAALQVSDEIGSLEVGKKADFVCHDTERPEWRPVLNPVSQLIWSADGRGVHSVWVDGERVVENYRSTRIDEEALYAEAQIAGEAIVKRAGLPLLSPWPII